MASISYPPDIGEFYTVVNGFDAPLFVDGGRSGGTLFIRSDSLLVVEGGHEESGQRYLVCDVLGTTRVPTLVLVSHERFADIEFFAVQV